MKAQEVREKFGLATPAAGDEILAPQAKTAPQVEVAPEGADENHPESAIKYPFDTRDGKSAPSAALQTQGPSAGRSEPLDPAGEIAGKLEVEGAPAMAAMLGQVEAMLSAASDLAEFREMLLSGFSDIDESLLAQVMAQAFATSFAAGRVMVEEDGG